MVSECIKEGDGTVHDDAPFLLSLRVDGSSTQAGDDQGAEGSTRSPVSGKQCRSRWGWAGRARGRAEQEGAGGWLFGSLSTQRGGSIRRLNMCLLNEWS